MKLFLFPALVLFAVAPAFVSARGSAQDAPKRVEITAKRFDFSPSDITVKKGQPVTIALTSQDVDHGIKFKELGVTVNGKKGQTKEVTFTPDKAGTFTGQCSIFCGSGHGGMKLMIHVTE